MLQTLETWWERENIKDDSGLNPMCCDHMIKMILSVTAKLGLKQQWNDINSSFCLSTLYLCLPWLFLPAFGYTCLHKHFGCEERWRWKGIKVEWGMACQAIDVCLSEHSCVVIFPQSCSLIFVFSYLATICSPSPAGKWAWVYSWGQGLPYTRVLSHCIVMMWQRCLPRFKCHDMLHYSAVLI